MTVLEKTLYDIDNSLTADRTKLHQDVFLERHLPTIIKNNGRPTKALQEELIKLAGGETKVIDVVDKDGNKIISLPPAIGSNITISNKEGNLKNLNFKLGDAAEAIKNAQQDESSVDKILDNKTKEEIIKEIKNDPWKNVITHFGKEIEPVKTNIKKQDKITFDYD